MKLAVVLLMIKERKYVAAARRHAAAPVEEPSKVLLRTRVIATYKLRCASSEPICCSALQLGHPFLYDSCHAHGAASERSSYTVCTPGCSYALTLRPIQSPKVGASWAPSPSIAAHQLSGRRGSVRLVEMMVPKATAKGGAALAGLARWGELNVCVAMPESMATAAQHSAAPLSESI